MQQPMIVVQQPETNTGVQAPPYQVNSALNDESSYVDKVEDLNAFSWIVCICCNFCGCGLIGFIMTQIGNAAKEAGHYKFAYFNSLTAKKFLIAGVGCGTVCWIIFIIYYATMGAALKASLEGQ
mmetsp:Transcript_50439/g.83931  ORF Transcript_50439/g.83931 Transcript_50439/m.83931 type:complete len:124 (+) Transcript_50439:97-468(+)